MSDSTSPNSRNPANDGSLAGVFTEILGKFLQGVDDMLPAVVLAYDRVTNRATVRPLIMMLTTDGIAVQRAEVASIPVFNIGGGNAVLSFNIKPGDFGWIKANDRDISLFMQQEAETSPNTVRKHDFGDAIFFPDAFRSRWTLDAGDLDSTVLQTIDGTQRIILHDDHVQIFSDTRILFDAPIIDILASATLSLDAPTLDITGANITVDASATLLLEGTAVNITGPVVATSTIEATNFLSSVLSVDFNTHVHGGVTTGGGVTLIPQ